MRDAELVDRALEQVEVADVAVEERDPLELLRLEDQLEPVWIRPGVEADDRGAFVNERPACPRTDGAEGSRYQKTLRRLRRQ